MSINLSELAELEQLARKCTLIISRSLQPGMTEEAAVDLMEQWLRQHGIKQQTHQPLAWFGSRLKLASHPPHNLSLWSKPEYLPSATRLEKNQAFALYCAPRIGNQIAESLHCDNVGTSPTCQQINLQLAHIKRLLLQGINQRKSVAELTYLIRQLATAQGATLSQNGLGGNWVRPYTEQPDIGTINDTGLFERVISLKTEKTPRHLPTSNTALHASKPLPSGLWIIQPWLDNGQLAAGMRRLLYIKPSGKATWLNSYCKQSEAA